jgi:hypothetical protein
MRLKGRPAIPCEANTRSRVAVGCRSLPHADAIVVAPATYNTINKWALGISDTYALGILAEAPGLRIPVVVLPIVNAALAANPSFHRIVATSVRSASGSCLDPGSGNHMSPAQGVPESTPTPGTWRLIGRRNSSTSRNRNDRCHEPRNSRSPGERLPSVMVRARDGCHRLWRAGVARRAGVAAQATPICRRVFGGRGETRRPRCETGVALASYARAATDAGLGWAGPRAHPPDACFTPGAAVVLLMPLWPLRCLQPPDVRLAL